MRKRGRPRRRWVDCIEEELKKEKAERGRSSKQSPLETVDEKHRPHIKVGKDGGKEEMSALRKAKAGYRFDIVLTKRCQAGLHVYKTYIYCLEPNAQQTDMGTAPTPRLTSIPSFLFLSLHDCLALCSERSHLHKRSPPQQSSRKQLFVCLFVLWLTPYVRSLLPSQSG